MSYTYEYNTKPNLCYYVNLNTYTKGKFGNTNFNPPLTDPIVKTNVSYQMNNYNSLGGNYPQNCSHNTKNFVSYPYLGSAYKKPICEICSVSDCK